MHNPVRAVLLSIVTVLEVTMAWTFTLLRRRVVFCLTHRFFCAGLVSMVARSWAQLPFFVVCDRVWCVRILQMVLRTSFALNMKSVVEWGLKC